MTENLDRDKIVESLFDPVTSTILAELEDGGKEINYLTNKVGITEDEIRQRLSYLLLHNFVHETKKEGRTVFSADADKLAQIIEKDENFNATIDGLTKMDSYLN